LNIIVLGAGAIGSVYGARLSARHAVTLVGRPSHVQAIERTGLRLVGLEERTWRVRAATTVDAIPPNALILLTTKVSDTSEAIPPIVPLVRSDTTIVCLQNGLYSEAIVKELVGDRCVVLRGITQFGAIFLEPGVVELKVAGHTLL